MTGTAVELYRPTGAQPGHLPVLHRPLHVEPRNVTPATSRRVAQEPRPARFVLPELSPPEWLDSPPELVQQPPRPYDGLRTLLAKLNNDKNDAVDRTLLGGGAAALVIGCLWYPWLFPLLVGLGWMVAIAYGLGLAWMCHVGRPPRRWTLERAALAVGGLSLLGTYLMFTASLVTLVLLSLLAVHVFSARTITPETGASWASPAQLVHDWISAGLLSDKLESPWFRRVGSYHEDENGIQSLTVIPMDGPRRGGRVLNIGVEKVEAARAGLERVMGLKVGQLHVSHDDEHDAGAVTLTVTPPIRKDIVKAVLPLTWDYDQPLPVGRDRRARPHERPTWGRHAMFVGATGSGKTWAGRYEIAHAVLDPRISFYLIDGKGDAVDWEPLHPLCKRYVLGASKASAEKAYAILQEIEQVSDSRSQLLGDADGIVVVVDEWYRLIGAAGRYDKALAGNMAALFSELLATARSRRIRFLTFWQRGTDSYIDTDMRGNMVQRFVGVTGDKADARYPLDAVPDELPKAPGQFNYKDSGSRPVLITMPALDRDAFATACARGLELRKAPLAAPADPLLAAVYEALAGEPLKASQVLSKLPAELRPEGADPARQAQTLGYKLKKMPGVEDFPIRGQKHYRLSPVAVPSQPRQAGGNPTSDPGSGSDSSMEEPASVETAVSP
jgi:hypothetical protein